MKSFHFKLLIFFGITYVYCRDIRSGLSVKFPNDAIPEDEGLKNWRRIGDFGWYTGIGDQKVSKPSNYETTSNEIDSRKGPEPVDHGSNSEKKLSKVLDYNALDETFKSFSDLDVNSKKPSKSLDDDSSEGISGKAPRNPQVKFIKSLGYSSSDGISGKPSRNPLEKFSRSLDYDSSEEISRKALRNPLEKFSKSLGYDSSDEIPRKPSRNQLERFPKSLGYDSTDGISGKALRNPLEQFSKSLGYDSTDRISGKALRNPLEEFSKSSDDDSSGGISWKAPKNPQEEFSQSLDNDVVNSKNRRNFEWFSGIADHKGSEPSNYEMVSNAIDSQMGSKSYDLSDGKFLRKLQTNLEIKENPEKLSEFLDFALSGRKVLDKLREYWDFKENPESSSESLDYDLSGKKVLEKLHEYFGIKENPEKLSDSFDYGLSGRKVMEKLRGYWDMKENPESLSDTLNYDLSSANVLGKLQGYLGIKENPERRSESVDDDQSDGKVLRKLERNLDIKENLEKLPESLNYDQSNGKVLEKLHRNLEINESPERFSKSLDYDVSDGNALGKLQRNLEIKETPKRPSKHLSYDSSDEISSKHSPRTLDIEWNSERKLSKSLDYPDEKVPNNSDIEWNPKSSDTTSDGNVSENPRNLDLQSSSTNQQPKSYDGSDETVSGKYSRYLDNERSSGKKSVDYLSLNRMVLQKNPRDLEWNKKSLDGSENNPGTSEREWNPEGQPKLSGYVTSDGKVLGEHSRNMYLQSNPMKFSKSLDYGESVEDHPKNTHRNLDDGKKSDGKLSESLDYGGTDEGVSGKLPENVDLQWNPLKFLDSLDYGESVGIHPKNTARSLNDGKKSEGKLSGSLDYGGTDEGVSGKFPGNVDLQWNPLKFLDSLDYGESVGIHPKNTARSLDDGRKTEGKLSGSLDYGGTDEGVSGKLFGNVELQWNPMKLSKSLDYDESEGMSPKNTARTLDDGRKSEEKLPESLDYGRIGGGVFGKLFRNMDLQWNPMKLSKSLDYDDSVGSHPKNTARSFDDGRKSSGKVSESLDYDTNWRVLGKVPGNFQWNPMKSSANYDASDGSEKPRRYRDFGTKNLFVDYDLPDGSENEVFHQGLNQQPSFIKFPDYDVPKETVRERRPRIWEFGWYSGIGKSKKVPKYMNHPRPDVSLDPNSENPYYSGIGKYKNNFLVESLVYPSTIFKRLKNNQCVVKYRNEMFIKRNC